MNKTHDIKSLYEQGLSTTELAELTGLSRSTIYRRLKSLDVAIRDKSNSIALARTKNNWLSYELNIPDFTTEKSAYWLGFLLGDGCVQISKRSGSCVRLDLKASDIEHLEKFREWLGSNHPIKYRSETKSYSVRIVSKELVKHLVDYGIVPNKSNTAEVDKRLESNPNFWRGLVDADGWLSKERNGTIGVTGTYSICQSFISFVKETTAQPVYKRGHCYSVTFTARLAQRIISKLYDSNTPRLARKGCVADAILQVRPRGG